MYNPTVGRFITEDPLGLASGDPNLYRYAGNSPTTVVDPTGLIGTKPKERPTPPPVPIEINAPFGPTCRAEMAKKKAKLVEELQDLLRRNVNPERRAQLFEELAELEKWFTCIHALEYWWHQTDRPTATLPPIFPLPIPAVPIPLVPPRLPEPKFPQQPFPDLDLEMPLPPNVG